ncbi:uroporphyrinogen-III C-methyltransferase [Shigella flexneri]
MSEWRINLQKSWQNFMDNFITIRRRDDTAVPLLAPNQDIHLREKYSLSPAGRSTSCTARHQEETYRQALEYGFTSVPAYDDTDDATTKAFLDQVDQLSQQNISMDFPETLQSGDAGNPMQTRVANLLAQPAAEGS